MKLLGRVGRLGDNEVQVMEGLPVRPFPLTEVRLVIEQLHLLGDALHHDVARDLEGRLAFALLRLGSHRPVCPFVVQILRATKAKDLVLLE